MLNNIKEPHHIDKIIQRVFKDFEQPLKIEGIDLYVKLSIGIAIYPDDSNELDKLIKYADTAMYQVKHTGKNNYGYFNKKHYEIVKPKYYLRKKCYVVLKKINLNCFIKPK